MQAHATHQDGESTSTTQVCGAWSTSTVSRSWLRWSCVTHKASVCVRRKHCVCVLVLVTLNMIAQLQIALPLLWCQPMVTYLGLFLAFGQLITKI